MVDISTTRGRAQWLCIRIVLSSKLFGKMGMLLMYRVDVETSTQLTEQEMCHMQLYQQLRAPRNYANLSASASRVSKSSASSIPIEIRIRYLSNPQPSTHSISS